jgi:predicted ATPase
MNRKVFEQIWNQLRIKKSQSQDFLERIRIENLRGIKDLNVDFNFPVSVIAGANASGKSTVLFASACAYQVPDKGNHNYTPANMFPNLKTKQLDTPNDAEPSTVFEFYYVARGKKKAMRWAKGKSWNRSFMGEKGGEQPSRALYLRTLANLTSPSEVRSVLQIAKSDVATSTITSDLLVLAQDILPIRYQEVKMLSKGDKDLLFAVREQNGAHYSEFHMSAGERAILRISKDISQLHNALILIDEIEAGLHPFMQQIIMLQLQRLALRHNLQIIVTSHSPVILDSVPVEAKIFLERTADNVEVKPPYKDIFQKAFYGQSLEKISILCEDEVAEALLLGVLDELNPKLGLTPDDVKVGKDTGKDSFPQHIEMIAKFDQLDNFIFVLDGDAKSLDAKLREMGSRSGKTITPLYLPGTVPEEWAWETLQQNSQEYAELIGLNQKSLDEMLQNHDKLFDNATDKPAVKIKNKFYAFCERLKRSHTELIRTLARRETQRQSFIIQQFINEFELQLRRWQARE